MSDPINNPEHYNTGSIECIEAIEASMTPEEFKGYLKGSVIKYLWRYQNKNNPAQDLEKCLWFLKRLLEKPLQITCAELHRAYKHPAARSNMRHRGRFKPPKCYIFRIILGFVRTQEDRTVACCARATLFVTYHLYD